MHGAPVNGAGWIGAALLVLAGCESTTGVGWEEQPGQIHDLQVRVGGVPAARVTAGTALEVVVTSEGSGSCTRPGPVVPTANSSRLSLQVFDFVATGATTCTDDVVHYTRTVLHTFFQSGEKTIRAIGRGDDVVVTVDVTSAVPPPMPGAAPTRASAAPLGDTHRTARQRFAGGTALPDR